MEAILPNWSAIPQLFIFLAALIVVKFFILNPVSQVLKGRSERIEGAEHEAVRLGEQSDKLDASYREKIREARSQVKRDRGEQRKKALSEEKDILNKGREEAHKKLEAIAEEIRKESDAARSRLKDDAAGMSRMLAEKLLGRPVS